MLFVVNHSSKKSVMKKILVLSLCVFFYVEKSQGAIQEVIEGTTFLKQDPKASSQPIQKKKKKNKRTKKVEKKEMIDQKISISDENQPVNKRKTKKK